MAAGVTAFAPEQVGNQWNNSVTPRNHSLELEIAVGFGFGTTPKTSDQGIDYRSQTKEHKRIEL